MLWSAKYLATWARARFGSEDRGASLIEYALLAAVIAEACIAAMTVLGSSGK